MSTEQSYKKTSGIFTQFLNTGISLLKVLLRSKFSSNLPSAESETCIILGNGPSLKTSFEKHSDFIAKHSLMCVNNFATTNEFEKLKPSFYAMLDPCYWIDEPNEMAIKCLSSLQEKTTWKIKMLLPNQAKKSTAFNNLSKQNKNIEIVYYNYTVFKGFESVAHAFYRKNLAMPQSQNILVACLFLGINMGFKQLYLLGADHTWHENILVNDNSQLCLKDSHFYDNAQQLNYRLFYKDEHQKDTFTMSEILFTFSKIFSGYEAIKKYSETKNCKIFNASEVTFIDAFERKKL